MTCKKSYTDKDLPTHPCFKVIGNSEHQCQGIFRRRLVTMVKIKEFTNDMKPNIPENADFDNMRDKILFKKNKHTKENTNSNDTNQSKHKQQQNTNQNKNRNQNKNKRKQNPEIIENETPNINDKNNKNQKNECENNNDNNDNNNNKETQKNKKLKRDPIAQQIENQKQK